ncbi:hypothetical protein RhiirA5_441356 [Rhizophagus irregularis]|uniref:Uncharacterized protein n=1 Tax=Rhizophagus irregularis TaxID=588596 RepID=A0A2N0NFP0_9GLOM|nr:hypothetical protein RhiirA5_441356 [Rhizophagus irregularis]
MEEIFIKGGSNIAVTKNERKYFCRMFDAKLDTKKIKERYNWQAYKKLDDKEKDILDFTLIKDYIGKYGGNFAKVIKINKIKFILIYFNEKDLLQAIYRSTMDEDMGKGLQMKGQEELIGMNGVFTKRRFAWDCK